MTTYTVIVKMADGEKIEIKNATAYDWKKDAGCLSVDTSTGYRQIFNCDCVSYVGRKFDLDGEN